MQLENHEFIPTEKKCRIFRRYQNTLLMPTGSELFSDREERVEAIGNGPFDSAALAPGNGPPADPPHKARRMSVPE
jgi:hypothetical protein